MKTLALELDVRHDYQAQRIVAEARERLPLRLSQNETERRAQEAVTFARDKVMENDAAADMRDLRFTHCAASQDLQTTPLLPLRFTADRRVASS